MKTFVKFIKINHEKLVKSEDTKEVLIIAQLEKKEWAARCPADRLVLWSVGA